MKRASAWLVFCCAIGLTALGCGGDETNTDEETLREALSQIGLFTPVRLDTAALAAAVQSGRPVQLPFARQGAELVQRQAQLTLRNLRGAGLTAFVLKDGAAGTGSSVPLPAPATYQGTVQGGGVAVFTVTNQAVEGSMLVAPDGWSFIEPLEPQLRLRQVDPAVRERLLAKYNHIVYNTLDARVGMQLGDDVLGNTTPAVVPEPQPSSPLVMSIVADGDEELFRAFPLDSVMPFWLKQETLLNAIDWLYNCVEPDQNGDNAYADCGNEFDGGVDAFQARLRIDRLEVWTAGGPNAPDRGTLLVESVTATHQAEPPCCGAPHTAGRSSLVHFFSGKDLQGGAGEAAGIGGLDYYDDLCFAHGFDFLCHHAVSQLVPNSAFPGNAFFQQLLVAHEIGHNNNAREDPGSFGVCWLFGEACGSNLMGSLGFSGESIYLYRHDFAEELMGPLLRERLGD